MSSGSVKHVVLFKFKPEVSESKIRDLIQGYKDLTNKIEEMKHFEWGADVSVENLTEGYTHCFITTFANAAGRDAYIPHVEHKKYVDVLFPHLEKVLVVDFSPEVVK